MAAAPRILIYDNQRVACSFDLHGTVELGRQNDDEEGPYSRSLQPTCTRIVIARRDELDIFTEAVAGGTTR